MQQLAVDSPAAQLQSGWRPNHVIEAVSGRRYTFGAELNTRPREAEIRKAIEWAESGTPQAHGEFMRHILPMILIMDPDLPPPTRIRQSSVLSLDLEALFKAGREAEFKKVFEGLEQAKPEDWGELIDLRFQELALRQYAPEPIPNTLVTSARVPKKVVVPPEMPERTIADSERQESISGVIRLALEHAGWEADLKLDLREAVAKLETAEVYRLSDLLTGGEGLSTEALDKIMPHAECNRVGPSFD